MTYEQEQALNELVRAKELKEAKKSNEFLFRMHKLGHISGEKLNRIMLGEEEYPSLIILDPTKNIELIKPNLL